MRTSLVLFLVGFGIFAAFAGSRLKIHSADNHFVYLADSLLNGHVEMRRKAPHQNDWASYKVLKLKGKSAEAHGASVKGFFTRRKGKSNQFRLLSGDEIEIPRKDRGASETKTYVSFPPMPAVLMMPLVAISGYGANDVIFTVLFAALNVVLVFLLLQRLSLVGYSERTRRENLWLTVVFAFGSAHLWCAVLGQVWFTALIVGVTFHLAYLYFAIDARRPLIAGLLLAAAFSTRASLLFAAVFFYWQLFRPASGERLERRELIRRFALFSAPCLVAGVTLLIYNYVRFENPIEFGHTYLAGGHIARIRDYGMFHPHFITRNLSAAFTLVPRVDGIAPYLHLSKHGMSLLLTTPVLAYLLWPKRTVSLARPMAITALIIAVPLLFYQNTGWEQFGYRFSLDLMPLLICLLAVGGRSFTRTFKALVIAGVLVNVFGAVTFKRAGMPKLYGQFIAEEPHKK